MNWMLTRWRNCTVQCSRLLDMFTLWRDTHTQDHLCSNPAGTCSTTSKTAQYCSTAQHNIGSLVQCRRELWLLCTAHQATVPVRLCPTCLLLIDLRGTHTSTHARDTYLAGSQPHPQDEDEGKSSTSEMDEQDARPTCAVGHTRI